ncbi:MULTISPECIES: McrB family protein [Bacillaceae]|uniref:Uncharacterized protein n=1 Tax=Evansella alkalicola TaxID=745819 RepID=A0ABS6JZ13_9BACI|nr:MULTISPECIES: hypothetical protein [Bacillaceae]MBU9723827.1 hypothetical protein [Bacillus alkalicola]
MIDSSRWTEINSMEDAGERSQTILNEIQPKLREILDQFIHTYQTNAPELGHYFRHGYESTLKTTVSDAKNPKYAEKKKNYGRKGFVELQEHRFFREPYSESIFTALKLNFNLEHQQIRIEMNASFYPILVGGPEINKQKFAQMIEVLSEDIEIWVIDDGLQRIAQHNLHDQLKSYFDKRRTPTIHFGKIVSIDGTMREEDLLELMWDTYEKLAPVRQFVSDELETHSSALTVLDKLKEHNDTLPIRIHNHDYKIVLDDVVKMKTHVTKQAYSVYEKEQLIVQGDMLFIHRGQLGKEFLGVRVKNAGMMYPQIRPFLDEKIYEWTFRKSFYQRGRHNEDNQNQLLQEQAHHDLRKNGFTFVDEQSFLIGHYDNSTQEFQEDIGDIKSKLITASLIFADVKGHISLPKGESGLHSQEKLDEDDEDLVEGTESISFDLVNIFDAIEGSEFTFSKEIIRDFHLNMTSLEDKHFVILNGISGTGKTQLSKIYANAVYGLNVDDDNPYLKIIPVRPDWMDSTALFGYYSSFEKKYIRTEFLDVLLRANEEKDRPFFVVLDEMNLAKVEYYLSDYLSAVESKMPIQLHVNDEVEDIPKTVEIPNNIYLIGTINVDETTHSLSDKVLDRAFVMTLSDVDLETFWDRLDNKFKDSLQLEWGLLTELHSLLIPYDLHFGYRTVKEMLRKLHKNATLPAEIRMERIHAVDRVISEKVLPKLRGDEQLLPLFDAWTDWCKTRLEEGSETMRHLDRMRKELDRYGATQFWR